MDRRVTLALSLIVLVLCGPQVVAADPLQPEPAVSRTSDLKHIRGVVKSSSEAVLASQTEGRVVRLPFSAGQRFRKGQSLVLMDCEKHQAQLASAKAEHEARKKTLESNLSLLKLKAIGKLEVKVAAAEVKKAQAAIRIAQVNVKGCRVLAPFSGRVVKVLVNAYENVFPNTELISILDDRHLEIDLILPSRALVWLDSGTSFSFQVDETGVTHQARVTEIGASVDPASQTVNVIGTFTEPVPKVLPGMSGTAQFIEQPQGLP